MLPGRPRIDAPSYAPRACDDGRQAESNQQLLVVPTELILVALLQNRRGRDPRLLQSEHRAFARPPPEVLGERPCSARWLRMMADLAARRFGH